MRRFTYKSRDGPVEVLVGVDYNDALREITKRYTGCASFISASIFNRVSTGCLSMPINDGEGGKSIETALNIIRWAYDNGIDRDGLFIGVGGGSVLDVVGFSASIYLRGVDYVNVPSTMLSMVDAALGGKTGVNAAGMKNVIGVIRQPRSIIVDLSFLRSLPRSNYVDGFAEVIKYGITMDGELLNYVVGHRDELMEMREDVLEEVVYRSLINKAGVVERDELDRAGVRAVLNYGHTVGHAIESATNFSVSHGRAVALGMICESKIGVKLGYTPKDVPEILLSHLESFGLITDIRINGIADRLAAAIVRDKKRSGDYLRLPVVTDIGRWELVKVDARDFIDLVVRECGSTP
ncbi:MAG: 3-dehydroquinate synthase [Vulcanisaeta sp.]